MAVAIFNTRNTAYRVSGDAFGMLRVERVSRGAPDNLPTEFRAVDARVVNPFRPWDANAVLEERVVVFDLPDGSRITTSYAGQGAYTGDLPWGISS